MGYKKFFKPVNSVLPARDRSADSSSSFASTNKYNNWLPEVYSGPPDRLQRYSVYDQMSYDHEISAAVDTIADFGTEPDEVSKLTFVVDYNDQPTPTEIQLIDKTLKQWVRMNKFNRRMWGIFRSTLVYGDQFFIRDPQTFELYWVDPGKVEKVIVNESEGKKIESYFVKDVDLNVKNLVATNQLNKMSSQAFGVNSVVFSPPVQGNMNYVSGSFGSAGSANYKDGGSMPIDAEHVIQLSLTDTMNASWPFGVSVLEKIYKVYKQKELLEDAILIYRIHRAPERRVFFIDVGTMPPNKASQYLERIRYEVQQKRIPSRTGGGSNIVDASYNPMCLALDTKIPLLDGRILELNELIAEYESGKENWAYSCHPETGNICPGMISWAGVTRKNTQVMKIMLDNGESITCTPDHKFPVLGKGFVEAQHLTVSDPLISFETRYKSLTGRIKDQHRAYQQVFNHSDNTWKYTHRVVAEFMKDRNLHTEFLYDNKYSAFSKDTVHHANYNRLDNSVTNLLWMNSADHRVYHSATKKEYWASLSPEDAKLLKLRISDGCKQYKLDNEEEFAKRYVDRDTTWISNMEKNDPDKFKKWRRSLGDSLSNFYKSDSARAKELKAASAINLKKNKAVNQTLNIPQAVLTRLVEIVKEHDSNRLETIELANNDLELMKLIKDANPVMKNSTRNVNADKFTDSKLKKIYNIYGFKDFKDFKTKIATYNHRIVSIEFLPDTIDTGCITIDQNEIYHNHHTFALASGVFCKNSSLEDYYFSVSSEGRGSRIEVLPGGDNLGSIDDLRYFNNKMLRALGVPSSYLPTGPDDGTASMSDGKVGTAYIQEFRFSKVVTRYQQQIIEPLDREFKLFLKHRGITIDSSLFQLNFAPAQSFSEYRQLELDSARINAMTALTDVSFMSKRFLLKTYLGWTEEQLAENERMWKEERSRLTKSFAPDSAPNGSTAGLSDIGITSSGIDGMAPDGSTGPDEGGSPDMAAMGDPGVTDSEVSDFGN